MRLRLLERFRRTVRRWQAAYGGGRTTRADAVPPPAAGAGTPGSHRRVSHARPSALDRSALHRRTGNPAPGPAAAAGAAAGSDAARAERQPRGAARAAAQRQGAARAAVRSAPGAVQMAAAQAPKSSRAQGAGTPWYEIAQGNRTAAGRRNCGRLEEVVRREWAADAVPPPEAVRAIDRLAELPQLVKEKLAAGLDAIHVGAGGVPDLDDMGRLKGVPLPSGRATWDACAGAYGERKIIVGSRPSPTPDVMCHEIGHALDDIDGPEGQWQSDSAEFLALYEQCLPSVRSDFHRQRGMLGRREFFADAFAAIASSQRPALVDMLGGDTRAALNVMLYFNVRYGI